jgi:prophage maintenance system killer protein
LTSYLALEDWISLVFAYLEDLTPGDLLEMNAAAAARALAVPRAKVGEADLYDDIHEKAASSLLEMLRAQPLARRSHNREVAVLTASFFLAENGHGWRPNTDELPYWVVEGEAGRLSVTTLGRGIAQHCQSEAPCA